MPTEDDDVLNMLTSQVLGEVLMKDGMLDDVVDTCSCDASSFDLKEGKMARIAPIKRAID